ncbi:UTP--glucose-1-phosphate uridylyltransferase-like [Stegodyphus dumicola]|uniref:UTP--glucose-1-phosphate uridylyltransferase-like n=1 Tax=Stegodyphus dumicola TaxID=202533 RepID=UPI0015AC7958|nr:UTP--glucose-1-phosphate uridylyltransferase-like [Stegodyphus dumicola]
MQGCSGTGFLKILKILKIKLPIPNLKKRAFGKQRKVSDSTEFKQLTKQDAKNELAKELEKILNTAPSTVEKQRTAEEFRGFQRLFSQFLQGTSSTVQWDKIEPLPEGAFHNSLILTLKKR